MSTRVVELTAAEYRAVIADSVEQKLLELLGDPDEGLELQEQVKVRLRRTLKAQQDGDRGIPAADVPAELGLEW
jgi:hypothetical protein